jgi:hypothetical protein
VADRLTLYLGFHHDRGAARKCTANQIPTGDRCMSGGDEPSVCTCDSPIGGCSGKCKLVNTLGLVVDGCYSIVFATAGLHGLAVAERWVPAPAI